jgi:hypothetical protein
MLSAMLGPIALAAMPFGFALGDPSRALAALFLMLGILVSVVSVSAVGENARAQMSVVLFAVISTLGIALACVMPGWFGPIAYGIGVLAFVQCGLLLAAQVVEK